MLFPHSNVVSPQLIMTCALGMGVGDIFKSSQLSSQLFFQPICQGNCQVNCVTQFFCSRQMSNQLFVKNHIMFVVNYCDFMSILVNYS